MQIRRPIVAGQFYPGDRDSCLEEIEEYAKQKLPDLSLPEEIVAGIVPHAGWAFSGSLAAMAFTAIKTRHEDVDTFVIFGAAHGYFSNTPSVYGTGSWLTPLGEIAIDEQLANDVLESGLAIDDSNAHRTEHSIEVQVPFIQHIFANAKIVPILVPAAQESIKLGECIGNIIKNNSERKIICLGSTDLTHYGPRYGFTPVGTGSDAIDWATRVNDRQFIDLALKLQPEAILANSAEHYNACGPGAAAATVAAVKKLGKTEGVLLAHTNSSEIMLRKLQTSSTESVGYATIVF